MFDVILVGTDGSLTADQAVARAAEMASQTGDALHIVTAYRSSRVDKSDREDSDSNVGVNEEALATLRGAAVLASQAGVTTETHAREGDPAEAIVGTAKDLHAQLIVIGSQGIGRRVFGSVPNAVLRDAGCDVLVVHTTR